MLLMQIYDELENVFFCASHRTIFIRKRYRVGEATNYFRLMTPSVDQSDELITASRCVIKGNIPPSTYGFELR